LQISFSDVHVFGSKINKKVIYMQEVFYIMGKTTGNAVGTFNKSKQLNK